MLGAKMLWAAALGAATLDGTALCEVLTGPFEVANDIPTERATLLSAGGAAMGVS